MQEKDHYTKEVKMRIVIALAAFGLAHYALTFSILPIWARICMSVGVAVLAFILFSKTKD
ncbi:MAG: hypothetical protein Q8O51_00380 [bacterium]|nr:hypothetical protein [bacterium]